MQEMRVRAIQLWYKPYQDGADTIVQLIRSSPFDAVRALKEIEMDKTLVQAEIAGKAQATDMMLEIVVIPVSDVDRAKRFYRDLGWRLDADFAAGDDWRVIQFTPPGSACSVIFGKNVTAAKPGSSQSLYLIVSDVVAARQDLINRGIEVGEVFHGDGDDHVGVDEPYISGRKRVGGPDPKHGSYQSFASFKDPDGNGWFFQEITNRLPGRVEGDTRFGSARDLAAAILRAAAAHGEHETRSGGHDEAWADWYAEYMVREQKGETFPA